MKQSPDPITGSGLIHYPVSYIIKRVLDSKNLIRVYLYQTKAKTITLSFGGWKEFSYSVDLYADNTRVNIRITP